MEEFKPLLKYNSKSFVISILEKMMTICDKVVIVTGFKNKAVKAEVNHYLLNTKLDAKKVVIVFNPDYKKGMFTSLQAGLKLLSDSDWLLYHFVDQPHIPQQFYSKFISQIEENYDWIQPVYNQTKGHPILLNTSLYSSIIDSNYNSLKEISQSDKVRKKFWKCKFPQVTEDIDTKADYQKLT